jgi:hypothetical protein
MKQSKLMRSVQAGWVILLAILMLSVVVTPVSAAGSTAGHTAPG